MLFKNTLRPCMATAACDSACSNAKSGYDNISFNMGQSASDDINAFGNAQPRQSAQRRPQRPPEGNPQRRRPPEGGRPSGGRPAQRKPNLLPIIGAAVGAVVALVLVILIFVAIFSSPGGSIKFEDNVYFAYIDADSKYQIAVNGKTVKSEFEGEISVLPSKNSSFAYVSEEIVTETESYTKLYILKGTKLKEIEAKVSEVICVADFEPGIVYEATNGLIHYYSESDQRDLEDGAIADNFCISADASAVAYTIEIKEEDGETIQELMLFRRAQQKKICSNFIPQGISNDGKYIYGTAIANGNFYSFEILKNSKKNDKPYAEHNISAELKNQELEEAPITATNATGDEIIFYTVSTEGKTTSYHYDAVSKKLAPIAAGKFTYIPASTDIASPKTLLNTYFTCEKVVDDEDSGKSETEILTYYLDKKEGARKLCDTVGEFSNDGKYFYFVQKGSLKKIELSSKDFDAEDFCRTSSFSLTENGSIYYITGTTSPTINYINGSGENNVRISYSADKDSISYIGDSIYFTETNEDGEASVYVSTNGSAKKEAKFDTKPVGTPVILAGFANNGYAYFEDENGNTSLYYTKDGEKFALVEKNCTLPELN